MSFSSSLKQDLIRIRLKTPSLRLCQLAGLTLSCASLHRNQAGTGLLYVTESAPVAKHIVSLSSGLYPLESTMELIRQARRKLPLYSVFLYGSGVKDLLTDTGYFVIKENDLAFGEGIPAGFVRDDETSRAFLRGAFLGSGSCVNPRRGYHVEFVLPSAALGDDLCKLIISQNLGAKCFQRKNKYIVYCKGEDVSGLLASMGASLGALEFENVRAEKDLRNYVNRKSNCETANIGKTVDAAVAQIHAIEVIDESMGLNRLPQPLYEAAMLRLNHPSATLMELAQLAEIGKSGMNHRLIRLIRMGEEIEHG